MVSGCYEAGGESRLRVLIQFSQLGLSRAIAKRD